MDDDPETPPAWGDGSGWGYQPGLPTPSAPSEPAATPPQREDRSALVATVALALIILLLIGIVLVSTGDDEDASTSTSLPRRVTSTLPTTTTTTEPPTTTTTLDPRYEQLFSALPSWDELELILGTTRDSRVINVDHEPTATAEITGPCAERQRLYLRAASVTATESDSDSLLAISVLEFETTDAARIFMGGKLAPGWGECVLTDERLAIVLPVGVDEERIAEGPYLAVGVAVTGTRKECSQSPGVMSSRQVDHFVIEVLGAICPTRSGPPEDSPTFDLAVARTVTDRVESRLPN